MLSYYPTLLIWHGINFSSICIAQDQWHLSPTIGLAMSSSFEQIHAEYANTRDLVLKQTNSSHVSECLDAIRPLWNAYQEKLKTQAFIDELPLLNMLA